MPARLIFPGFRFGHDDPASAERLVRAGVGGFCLYGGTPERIAGLVRRLQRLAGAPLLFCADYEDGAASHVAGATRFPSNMALGAAGSARLAGLKAELTAREAKAMGVRWVLAPVLDLATEPGNPIVNVRSFGADPAPAARLGAAYIAGLAREGVLSCAKHFPGHGETRRDSHLTLPSVPVSKARLLERELVPFFKAARTASAFMTAHLRVPALKTGRLPVSLSEEAGRFLRRALGFKGLVATDALDMRAVAGRMSEAEAAARALRAGADVLLVPKDPLALARSLPRLVAQDPALARLARASLARLARAGRACGLFEDGGRPSGGLRLVGCAAHRAAAEEMARAAATRLGARAAPLRRFSYLEASADGRAGGAFRAELRRLGVAEARGGTPLVASFLRPRAYRGTIRHDAARRKALSRALEAPGATLVSFGSPFVFDDLRGWSSGLCLYSADEASQRAAARVLAGAQAAPGRLPVRLREG